MMLRSAEKWLLPVMRHARMARRDPFPENAHVFLAICDHYEPLHRTDDAGALARLRDWRKRYPQLHQAHQDSGGRGPRHSFFYPIEQYHPHHLDIVAELCQETGSEVEVQLHHDNDTSDTLREQILRGITNFQRHGLLSTDPGGQTAFGFVHGNWALANSRPDGRWCGVSDELALLSELGCYADFTFPSAPSPTQPRAVNQIGYARECRSPGALDQLAPATAGKTGSLRTDPDHLLLVQGPLALNWQRRKWGILPRLENADLTQVNPPTAARTRLWLQQAIHVQNRPDWIFIKLHCHGAVPTNAESLIGRPAHAFHDFFTRTLPSETGLKTHYVTAREMVNLIHAAEDGMTGDPAAHFDHVYHRPR